MINDLIDILIKLLITFSMVIITLTFLIFFIGKTTILIFFLNRLANFALVNLYTLLIALFIRKNKT